MLQNAPPSMNLTAFEVILDDLRNGRMIILVDDAERENEGDLVVPTAVLTSDHVAFMMREARGLICVSVSAETASRLQLPLQTSQNNSPFHTQFTISVDVREVASQGGTASARTATMRALLDPASTAADFISPGNVFPLIANPAGVLGRQGQTEGSSDLARIAGYPPSGVICEILNPDGSMARGSSLFSFAEQHGLHVTSVEEVIRYRIRSEVVVRLVAERRVTTAHGEFLMRVFEDDVEGKEHILLTIGEERFGGPDGVLVRLHSECLTGDVFGSRRCDCGAQLAQALNSIRAAGSGALLYLRQEGRGIGLSNKLRAYALQDRGLDTVDANVELGFAPDERDYATAAQILSLADIRRVRLMTNNPAKIAALTQYQVEVVERVPLVVPSDEYSSGYLEAKRARMGHLF